jgi:hypothetical protein
MYEDMISHYGRKMGVIIGVINGFKRFYLYLLQAYGIH